MNGSLNGLLLRQFDQLRLAWAIAKYPMGPGTTTLPLFLQQQMIFPNLPKQGAAT